jgi:hypothetical protein
LARTECGARGIKQNLRRGIRQKELKVAWQNVRLRQDAYINESWESLRARRMGKTYGDEEREKEFGVHFCIFLMGFKISIFGQKAPYASFFSPVSSSL